MALRHPSLQRSTNRSTSVNGYRHERSILQKTLQSFPHALPHKEPHPPKNQDSHHLRLERNQILDRNIEISDYFSILILYFLLSVSSCLWVRIPFLGRLGRAGRWSTVLREIQRWTKSLFLRRGGLSSEIRRHMNLPFLRWVEVFKAGLTPDQE